MTKTSYAIALGSNRRHGRHGAPQEVVAAAFEALGSLGETIRRSAILKTAPLGPAGRSFANAAAILETELGPPELLQGLKQIESDFGRRAGRRWGARVLDLDIILWSEGPWGGPHPNLPHPESRNRRFVLDPLASIAPDWRDPITTLRVRHLLARLKRPAVDRAYSRS